MSDLDIIKKIEEELNVKLEKLQESSWSIRGYILNKNGQVKSLKLYECNINNFNRIFNYVKDLKYLTELNLSKNKLQTINQIKE